jgi:hypothetical protein
MARQNWSDEDRERALLALHDGATYNEVHADTGIPKGTLASWRRRQSEDEARAMREELDTPAERAEAAAARRERTAAARAAALEAKAEVTAEARNQLGARLLDEVHGLLDRMNSPTSYKHVKVVNQGDKLGATVEVVDVDLDLPTAQDTKALATSAAILIDKMQLVTGQATDRLEQMKLGDAIDLDAEYENLVAAARRGESLTQPEPNA